MANFNDLIKHYRNEVTNQDPDDYEESATHAAELIEGMASRYAEQVDADMTMSVILQAVAHYLDEQDDKFEKRKARNASIAQDAQADQGNNEGVEEEEKGSISSLSEGYKQEIVDGLKRILR